MMFEELVGGKGYSGGQEKDEMVHLKEDMSAFGMKFEGWRNAAHKAGRWFRRIEEGAESFMRKRHDADAELQSDTQRPRQRHPPLSFLSGRGEGGGGGGGTGERRGRGVSCPRD